MTRNSKISLHFGLSDLVDGHNTCEDKKGLEENLGNKSLLCIDHSMFKIPAVYPNGEVESSCL